MTLFVTRTVSVTAGLLFLVVTAHTAAQDPPIPAKDVLPAAPADKVPKPPAKIDVQPSARDSEIQERLEHILSATGWFEHPHVDVRDGVVFLTGVTETEDYRKWAEDLTRNTQDVAAIVNRIDVRQSALWDLRPARMELRLLWTEIIRSLPYTVGGAAVLLAAWWGARFAARLTLKAALRRVQSPLLRDVFAQAMGLVVFLIGLYLVLHIFGLTRLAVTVVGGTGLLGLILGIAFRDITENFLASIFLSVQPPFRTGDLVSIGGETGYVQSLTTRATVIMALEGNHVQIPNSTVYKSTIRNFSSNPNRRESFSVGIGYQEDIAAAQDLALKVLTSHPAVLKDPEPWVLVDSLGSAAVNLQIYFWLDGRSYGWLTVRSSIIRLIKQAFEEQGIAMPFEARSVLPLRDSRRPMIPSGHPAARDEKSPPRLIAKGEGGLESDAAALQDQAERSRAPEAGHDLLQPMGVDGSQ